MYQNQQEKVLWEQGKRAGLKQTMTAEQCRQQDSVIFRDGWREGMLQRILTKN